jgi:putative flippase GtrA
VIRIARLIDTYTPSALVYLLISLVSASVEWLSFYLLLAVDVPWRAAIYAFLAATSVNYVLCRTFAFRTVRPVRDEMFLLFLVSGVAFVFNFSAFVFLHSAWNVDPMAAKVAGTGVGFGFNYLLRQFYVFDRTTKVMSLSALAGWGQRRRHGELATKPNSAAKS